jgi:hypothetical protein
VGKRGRWLGYQLAPSLCCQGTNVQHVLTRMPIEARRETGVIVSVASGGDRRDGLSIGGVGSSDGGRCWSGGGGVEEAGGGRY